MQHHPPDNGRRPTRRLLDTQQLAGWDVLDTRGQAMGSVAQLVLDLLGGRMAYIVVATGGFLGVGESRFMLPWSGLRAADDGSRRLVWLGDPDTSRLVPGVPGTPATPEGPQALQTPPAAACCGNNYQPSVNFAQH